MQMFMVLDSKGVCDSIAVAGKDFIDEFIAVRKVENEYFSGKDFESQVLELYASY